VIDRLYPIVDVDVCARLGLAPRDVCRAFLAGGARLVQLRAKDLPSGPFLDLAGAMVDDANRAGGRIIVNDRADLALLAGAHGVHVGQDDVPPADVRHIMGPDAIVGFSTHTASQFAAAMGEPASYLAIGPLFHTGTKETGYEAVGLGLVREAADLAAGRRPIVAIGGITLERAPDVIAAGADAVAVITGLLDGDPEASVRRWIAALA
jgi:thiamine-phosphate pyrophosphorylase